MQRADKHEAYRAISIQCNKHYCELGLSKEGLASGLVRDHLVSLGMRFLALLPDYITGLRLKSVRRIFIYEFAQNLIGQ